MTVANLIESSTDVERLAFVMAQVAALEEETARAVLTDEGIAFSDSDVRQLVFQRYRYITLRLREHAL